MVGFIRQQRGMSLFSLLFIIALAAFFFTLLFKLGPVYMNYWTIRSIMDSVANPSEPVEGGARGISDQLQRRIEINDVDDVTKKDFVIRRLDDGTFEVQVAYEQRTHLFFNVDAVLAFDYQVEVTSP